MSKKISGGVAHDMPKDLEKALLSSQAALSTWEDITPLARNEWICWVISPKTEKTRNQHVGRAIEELAEGERRPCCWMGCIHRTDKPMSPSQQFVASRQAKTKA